MQRTLRAKWEGLSGYKPADVIAFLLRVHELGEPDEALIDEYEKEVKRRNSLVSIAKVRACLLWLVVAVPSRTCPVVFIMVTAVWFAGAVVWCGVLWCGVRMCS